MVSEKTAKRLHELVDEISEIVLRENLKHTDDAMNYLHLALANDIPFEDAPYDDAFFPYEIAEKITDKFSSRENSAPSGSGDTVIYLSGCTPP